MQGTEDLLPAVTQGSPPLDTHLTTDQINTVMTDTLQRVMSAINTCKTSNDGDHLAHTQHTFSLQLLMDQLLTNTMMQCDSSRSIDVTNINGTGRVFAI